MSGFTRLKDFQALLKQRGMNLTRLAAAIGAGRCHLSQVLNGHRSGGITRVALYKVLTGHELAALGWLDDMMAWLQTGDGKKYAEKLRKELHAIPANVPMVAQQ